MLQIAGGSAIVFSCMRHLLAMEGTDELAPFRRRSQQMPMEPLLCARQWRHLDRVKGMKIFLVTLAIEYPSCPRILVLVSEDFQGDL